MNIGPQLPLRKAIVAGVSGAVLLILSLGWVLFLLSEKERYSRKDIVGKVLDTSSQAVATDSNRQNDREASGQGDHRSPVSDYSQQFGDAFDNRPMTLQVAPALTVGQESGDLVGSDGIVIQAGIDHLELMGGGDLHILPGVYRIRNRILLRSKVNLKGSGKDTILMKSDGVSAQLSQNADWYETAIVVTDPAGFAPGDGVTIYSGKPGTEGMSRVRSTSAMITHIVERTLYLNHRVGTAHPVGMNAKVTNSFALLDGKDAEDMAVEDLILDGARATNEFMDGNSGGGVFLMQCRNINFRNVTVRNYNGDGFSFQACADVHFEKCRAENNAGFGFHIGSGSIRTLLSRCTSQGNTRGVYFCFGITEAIVEDCTLSNNGDYGISIGYRDTGNLIRDCIVEANGKVGVLFGGAVDDFGGGNRNVIVSCTIKNNGPPGEGIGIWVQGHNHGLLIEGNRFLDTGIGTQVTGLRIHPEAQGIILQGNQFENMKSDVDYTQPVRERAKELLGR